MGEETEIRTVRGVLVAGTVLPIGSVIEDEKFGAQLIQSGKAKRVPVGGVAEMTEPETTEAPRDTIETTTKRSTRKRGR